MAGSASVLDQGQIKGHCYVTEAILPGCDARRVLAGNLHSAQILTLAANAISELHRYTSAPGFVDEEKLNLWVNEPLAFVRQSSAIVLRGEKRERAFKSLADELQGAFAGRKLPLSWVHGDFSIGNILISPDGSQVTGIVDWEGAAPDRLAALDMVQLLLSVRMWQQGAELGAVVRGLMTEAHLSAPEQDLIDNAWLSKSVAAIGLRPLVLLAWLQHVAANLEKSTRFAKHPYWLNRNIESVLSWI